MENSTALSRTSDFESASSDHLPGGHSNIRSPTVGTAVLCEDMVYPTGTYSVQMRPLFHKQRSSPLERVAIFCAFFNGQAMLSGFTHILFYIVKEDDTMPKNVPVYVVFLSQPREHCRRFWKSPFGCIFTASLPDMEKSRYNTVDEWPLISGCMVCT